MTFNINVKLTDIDNHFQNVTILNYAGRRHAKPETENRKGRREEAAGTGAPGTHAETQHDDQRPRRPEAAG